MQHQRGVPTKTANNVQSLQQRQVIQHKYSRCQGNIGRHKHPHTIRSFHLIELRYKFSNGNPSKSCSAGCSPMCKIKRRHIEERWAWHLQLIRLALTHASASHLIANLSLHLSKSNILQCVRANLSGIVITLVCRSVTVQVIPGQ